MQILIILRFYLVGQSCSIQFNSLYSAKIYKSIVYNIQQGDIGRSPKRNPFELVKKGTLYNNTLDEKKYLKYMTRCEKTGRYRGHNRTKQDRTGQDAIGETMPKESSHLCNRLSEAFRCFMRLLNQ